MSASGTWPLRQDTGQARRGSSARRGLGEMAALERAMFLHKICIFIHLGNLWTGS